MQQVIVVYCNNSLDLLGLRWVWSRIMLQIINKKYFQWNFNAAKMNNRFHWVVYNIRQTNWWTFLVVRIKLSNFLSQFEPACIACNAVYAMRLLSTSWTKEVPMRHWYHHSMLGLIDSIIEWMIAIFKLKIYNEQIFLLRNELNGFGRKNWMHNNWNNVTCIKWIESIEKLSQSVIN